MSAAVPSVPGLAVVVLGGVDVATEITFPNRTRRATVFFETDDGKVAFSGTDGAAIDAAHATVTADQYWMVLIDRDGHGGKGPASLFLATSAGGTTVRVIAEAD
jgi:hypothetical protein